MDVGPLIVKPNVLKINGGQEQTTFALINNEGTKQVFYIKSTRPESLSVDIHSGFIKSFDRIEIGVTLDWSDPMVLKGKLLIQSKITVVPCSDWKETDAREVFKNVAKQPSEAKLRLRFVSPMSSENLDKAIESKSKKQPNKQNDSYHQDNSGIYDVLQQDSYHQDNSGIYDVLQQDSYHQDEPTVTQLCYDQGCQDLNSVRPADQILNEVSLIYDWKCAGMDDDLRHVLNAFKEQNKSRTSLNGAASSEQFKTEEDSNDKLDYPQIVTCS